MAILSAFRNELFMRGASILTLNQIVVAAATFLRNVIIARLISIEDYGIAATFALTMSILEMSSTLALDQILVQDEKGASDEMLASVHAMEAVKGLFTGLILFVFAAPVAHLFKLPEVIWAFQLLALIPMIKGLMHYDIVVRQRDMDFKGLAFAESVPQLLTVTSAYFVAVWLNDYRAMLFLVLISAIARTLISHLLATRPYRWLLRRDLLIKKFNFSWPLLVNGILMFGMFQGDRVLIGALFNMETLAWYSAAFSICLLPTLFISKIISPLVMPLLSSSRNDLSEHQLQCEVALKLFFASGTFIAIFFAISGKSILSLSFGEKYMQGGAIIAWLGVMQAVRTLRYAPALISISHAQTKNAMYANIARSSGVVLAVVFALAGYDVIWIAVGGIVGELLALAIAFWLTPLPISRRALLRWLIPMLCYFFTICAIALWVSGEINPNSSVLTHFYWLLAGGISGLAFSAIVLVKVGNGGERAQTAGDAS